MLGLERHRWLFIVCLIALMSAVVGAEVHWLAPVSEPNDRDKTTYEYYAIYAASVEFLFQSWQRFREWFDHDTIIGTAIVATAVFTATLSRSTRRLWKVSHRHAEIAEKALLGLERPYIFIREVRILTKPAGFIVDLQNYGRAPGVLEMVGVTIKWQINFEQFEEVGSHVMYKPLATGDTHSETISPTKFGLAELDAMLTKKGILSLDVSFEYSDTLGKTRLEKVPLLYINFLNIFTRHRAYQHEIKETESTPQRPAN